MIVTSRRALALCLLLPLLATALAAQSAPPPPPVQVMRAVGPQAGFGDQLVLGNGARLELGPAATDHSAVLLDGLEVTDAALAGPWSPGAHAVTVHAAEGTTAPVPMRFIYDPAPPTLQWEIGGTKLLDHHGLDENVHREDPPRHMEPERDKHVPVLWSPDGRRWLPVLARGAKADPTGALADWLTLADEPQIFLWALDDHVFGSGAPVAPTKLQLVRIWGADQLSAVRELRLRVLPGDPNDGDRAYRLEMVATDLVGNQSTTTWPLARH